MTVLEPSLFLVFLVFVAGLMTVATPCIIPILPPMLAGSVGHRLRPVCIVAGSAVTFTLMGGLFSAIGVAAGEFREILRLVFIFIIIGFGAVMVDDEINGIYVKYSSLLVNRLLGLFKKEAGPKTQQIDEKGSGLVGAFALGLSLGIVWIPCVGPILGSILAFAAYQENLLVGSGLLFVYSIGLGIPMLIIAYGGKHVSGRLGWVKHNSERIRKFAGWVLILTGISMMFGIDKLIQQSLLPYVPDIESMILERLLK